MLFSGSNLEPPIYLRYFVHEAFDGSPGGSINDNFNILEYHISTTATF